MPVAQANVADHGRSAEQVLEHIGGMPAQGFDDPQPRPALRNLGLKEILRATRKRYAAVPLGQADEMLVALLDLNGRVLATEELAQLAISEGRAPAGTSLGDAARLAAAALARQRGATRASVGAHTSDGVGREHEVSHVVAATAAGTPPARQRPASAGVAGYGGATLLAIFAALASLLVLTVRRLRFA